ncbi:uncharacterized protein BX663DRAFT_492329 [Cokeromyces recurvatus]|uniref:uncharacterized protein n=1 Tax=Cokeromyces recurvatus TaxID=90255 RepID=UPI00221E5DF2|nr:uncharacterized protein BX663DRAFT_492329 [Cokeromyces recurvatus]KAI7907897.1 hypothetical protein BX663DRAFT_492329 [Cokeromyces recurvatus]
MAFRQSPLSKLVIVDVIRAIVLRPISTNTLHTLPTNSTWKHTSSNFFNRFNKHEAHRFFSTQKSKPTFFDAQKSSPNLKTTETESNEVKRKEKYHYFMTKHYHGQMNKLVKGYTLKHKKPRPTTVFEYNKLIMFAILESRFNKAINIFREMENERLKPDIKSYTMIIDEYVKRSDNEKARKWVNRMLRQKIEPDAYIYTTLIDGYMQQANIDDTEAIFRLMMKRKIQPTLVTYNVLMHHSVRQLNMESALKFWGNLLDAGLKPDVYTFAIMLHGLGDEGRLKEAWDVYKKMQDENVNVNEVIVTTLMGMHVKQHDNEFAIQLYNKFFNSKESSLKATLHTRNVLLNALIANADVDTIKKYYHYYQASIKNKQKSSLFISANVVTYTTFMRAFLRRSALPMVSQVYEDMTAQKIQPTLVTYATLMLAHAYVPDPETCNRILEELRNSNIELNAIIYTIVMRAWAKSGRWKRVEDTYALMQQDNIKPTELTMEVLKYSKLRNFD